MDRYRNEVNRLYGVLNRRLAEHEYIAGAYSIADMASYPWIVIHERQHQNIADFPHIKRWLDAIKARPAVERAYAKAKEINPNIRAASAPRRSARSCSGRPRRRSGGGALRPVPPVCRSRSSLQGCLAREPTDHDGKRTGRRQRVDAAPLDGGRFAI